MNLLLLETDEIDPERASDGVDVDLAPGDRRARHLLTVLRAQPGQILRAGLLRGPTGRAEVVAVEDQRIRLRVVLDRPAAAPPRVDLILAVPRPKVLSRVVEAAASLGVRRIDLVNAWRVDRSYLASPRLRAAELTAAARLGCEQGATTWLPDIELHPLLMPFLRGHRRPDATHLVAHPRAADPIERAFPPGTASPAVVAIGPEGGWIDRELHTFADLGFAAIHLGSPILRVDAAVSVVLAQLALLARLEVHRPPADEAS